MKELDNDIAKVTLTDGVYYLKRDRDTTHFTIVNSGGLDFLKKGGNTGNHIGQHRDEPYYNDVKSWLKDGKVQMETYKRIKVIFKALTRQDFETNKITKESFKLIYSTVSYLNKKYQINGRCPLSVCFGEVDKVVYNSKFSLPREINRSLRNVNPEAAKSEIKALTALLKKLRSEPITKQ